MSWSLTSLALLALLLAAALAIGSLTPAQASSRVVAVKVEGAITYATYEVAADALSQASRQGSPLLVLLNTPGGSLDATKAMVEAFLNSHVPIVVYVHPRGATAWSAGSVILLAAHVAAMSPGTVVGSAQPVAYSPLSGAQPVEDEKVVNALAKYVEQVATLRGRNATAARLFVTRNLNLGCEEALEAGVADLVVGDVESLLKALHGHTLSLDGRSYTFDTEGAELEWFEGGLRSKALAVLYDPALASVLFTVGLMALILGLSSAHPAPALVGGLLTLLGLLGLGLDVNVAALILMAAGAVLLAVELFIIPGFGAFGVVGIIMLVVGALLSPFAASPERWSIHPEWLSGLSLMSYAVSIPLLGFAALALYKVLKARRLKPALHIAGLIGQVATALDELGPSKKGFVMCAGEYWEAVARSQVAPGERVKVVGKEGPTLIVEKLSGGGGGEA